MPFVRVTRQWRFVVKYEMTSSLSMEARFPFWTSCFGREQFYTTWFVEHLFPLGMAPPPRITERWMEGRVEVR